MKLLAAVEKNFIAQPESARQIFVQFDAGFGDAVSVRAVRGSVLPDPLGKREPEYYL